MTGVESEPDPVVPAVDASKAVTILYTNYRGESAKRVIVPHSIWFGCTEWHPEDQWLLEAYDLDKQAFRSFALRGLEMWAGSQTAIRQSESAVVAEWQ